MKKIIKYSLRVVLVLFILLNIITAFHAYKFTHFYDASEANFKRQADKTKWDITGDMFFGINAVKGKNKMIPDSTLQTVSLLTKDNINIEGWYFKTSAAKGTVILFHGHGGTKSGIINESAAFRKMGYNTFLIDFRAHGNSGGNTCTIGMMKPKT